MDSPPQRPVHRALTVVGGGVIGLTCALTAADAGWRVRVLDAGTDERASWVAGGMLGSLGEGHPGEDASLALSVESVRLWPALVKRLDDPGVVTATDSLFVAASATDIEYLRHLADFVWAGQPATDAALQSVTGRDIRTLEPSLSSRLVGGYRAVGEWSVDNRRLLEALRAVAWIPLTFRTATWLDDAQRAKLIAIADRCPVHRTLTSEIVIETDEV